MAKRKPSRPEISQDVWEVKLYGEDPYEVEEATNQIVDHYNYLVEGISVKIKSSLPQFVELEDLVSSANLGFARAISKFVPEKGRFSKYASTLIYGAVMDGLRSADFAPRDLRRLQRDMTNATQRLRDSGHTDPTDLDIAEEMGTSQEEVISIKTRLIRAEVVPSDPSTLVATSSHRVDSWTSLVLRDVVSWMRSLDRRVQEVVLLKFWEGRNNREISNILDISNVEINNIVGKFLDDLLEVTKSIASS